MSNKKKTLDNLRWLLSRVENAKYSHGFCYLCGYKTNVLNILSQLDPTRNELLKHWTVNSSWNNDYSGEFRSDWWFRSHYPDIEKETRIAFLKECIYLIEKKKIIIKPLNETNEK